MLIPGFFVPGPIVLHLIALAHARRAASARPRDEELRAAQFCGLVSDTAVCACNRRVPAALRVGRVRADSFDLAATASSLEQARALFAESTRQDGRSRSTEPAILVPRRSTSHVVWPKHSIHRVTDVSERPIAITTTVPTIVPVSCQNSASRANASQLA